MTQQILASTCITKNIIKNSNNKMNYYQLSDLGKIPVRIDIKRLIDVNNVLENEIVSDAINEIYFTLEMISHSKICSATQYSKISMMKLEINEPILFQWHYEDLSADSRIAITIWSSMKQRHPKKPLGSTVISLFDQNDVLRQGKFHLFIWPNTLPDHEAPTTTPGLTNDPNIQTLNFISEQQGKIQKNDVTSQLDIASQRALEALSLKLLYTYRLIPAAFLQVEFPTFASNILFHDKISKQYEEYISTKSGFNFQSQFNECLEIYDPDYDMNRPDPLQEIFYYQKRENEQDPEKILPKKEEVKVIDGIVSKTFKADSLKPFQKQLIYKYRYYLSNDKKYLIHFLHSVAWGTQEESQAIKLLQTWQKIEWIDALHLLSKEFAANSLYNNKKTRSHAAMKVIRDYATQIIASMSDQHIIAILLQLIQSIQYDAINQSSMATHLLERSAKNKQIAILVFWYLKTQTEGLQQKQTKTKNILIEKIQIYVNIFNKYVESLKTHEGAEETWEIIVVQEKFVKYLKQMSKKMKEIKNNTEREHEYRKRLGEFPWEEELGIIYFPLDLSIKLKRPIPEECSIFSSAMAPFKMTFETEDSGKHTFIYKNGDDLRQDQLILEMFSLMDNLLKGVNQDYRLTPYQTLATSKSDGFVQFIPKTKTFQSTNLKEYLHDLIQKKSELVMDNYVFSTAGYCAMTYFFIIGDRHLENLMINDEGKMCHIDFGFILGRDPKPYPPPIKISREMIDAMGVSTENPQQNSNYKKFKLKTLQAYLYLRKQSKMIYNLTVLMLDSGIKDVHPEGLNKLYDKFSMNLNDKEAQKYFLMVLQECKNALFPNITDTIHIWATYFRK